MFGEIISFVAGRLSAPSEEKDTSLFTDREIFLFKLVGKMWPAIKEPNPDAKIRVPLRYKSYLADMGNIDLIDLVDEDTNLDQINKKVQEVFDEKSGIY